MLELIFMVNESVFLVHGLFLKAKILQKAHVKAGKALPVPVCSGKSSSVIPAHTAQVCQTHSRNVKATCRRPFQLACALFICWSNPAISPSYQAWIWVTWACHHKYAVFWLECQREFLGLMKRMRSSVVSLLYVCQITVWCWERCLTVSSGFFFFLKLFSLYRDTRSWR